ncbi:hypothetical protein J6590_034127 [Homalodisca vitripennis]|nr:hypothetical protein J6590_034127 [Homalodisca vitripennis]
MRMYRLTVVISHEAVDYPQSPLSGADYSPALQPPVGFWSLTRLSSNQADCIIFYRKRTIYSITFTANRQAFISSAAVDLGIAGSVWRKSPDSKINAPPKHLVSLRRSFNVLSSASNARLWAIVHSSQIIIFDATKTFAIDYCKECAVRHPSSNVAAIPEEATETAMLDLARTVAKTTDMRNVLPVPPCKYKPPFPSSIAFINVS